MWSARLPVSSPVLRTGEDQSVPTVRLLTLRHHLPGSGCQRFTVAPVGSRTVLTMPLGVSCTSSTILAPSCAAFLVAFFTSPTEMYGAQWEAALPLPFTLMPAPISFAADT